MSDHFVIIGDSLAEVGGAGTIYIETRNLTTGITIYRKLRIDNFGLSSPRAIYNRLEPLRNLLDGQYFNLKLVGGVTWLSNDSDQYAFDMTTIEGNAHVAILSNTSLDDISIKAGLLTGDRSGVLHIGSRQTFSFSDVNSYIPVNIMAYRLVW